MKPLRIFINYRREDTAGHAGRLFDALASLLQGHQVFMDIDTLQPGVDYTEVIDQEVGSCDVLVALMGQRWLAVTDSKGRRRLDDPNDFVRREIATALDRHVRVIPILVQGLQMPTAEDLPDALEGLARRNALELSDARFSFDISRLVTAIESVAREKNAAEADEVATPPIESGESGESDVQPVVTPSIEPDPIGPIPLAKTKARRSGAKVVAFAVVGVLVLGAMGAAVLVSSRSTDDAGSAPSPGVSVAPSSNAPAAAAVPDCSGVSHPAQSSDDRRVVLDGLRRSQGYSGRYSVQTMTILRDWAYVEAAKFDEVAATPIENFSGYLAKLNGADWELRWEGPLPIDRQGGGSPAYPSDFDSRARDVIRCG